MNKFSIDFAENLENNGWTPINDPSIPRLVARYQESDEAVNLYLTDIDTFLAQYPALDRYASFENVPPSKDALSLLQDDPRFGFLRIVMADHDPETCGVHGCPQCDEESDYPCPGDCDGCGDCHGTEANLESYQEEGYLAADYDCLFDW